jgi:hypothetical protein
MRRLGPVFVLLLLPLTLAAQPLLQCAGGEESGLPLPSTFSKNNDPAAYEKVIGDFLRSGKYEKLHWCVDKGVRDTGPYIDGVYYGTHPAVRIWYSPQAATWVLGGRKGDIPDGAMIIKEQFAPTPAGQYEGWTEAQLRAYFAANYDWTFMVRDRNGSADGWYWGEIYKGEDLDSYAPPFAVFNTGFGLYCVRCHGSAESLLTFSATSNMKGGAGHPLTFRDDLSWFFNGAVKPPEGAPTHAQTAEHPSSHDVQESTHPHVDASSMPKLAVAHIPVNRDWAGFFSTVTAKPSAHPFPGENYDHIVSPAGKPQHFLTSDQCFGCHSGNRYGNVMLWKDTRLESEPLVNVSPYGEWRWSPMGLAGRDPIFYAQLDSERAYLAKHQPGKLTEITNLCFSCHGAMGERQLEIDSKNKTPFTPDYVMTTDLADPRFPYGALAREGISCAVCHHIAKSDVPLMTFIDREATGKFQLTASDELEGPFEKPAETPMKHSLNIKPVHDDYTKSARICGTCHTIHLPVVDAVDEPKAHATAAACQDEKFSFEQATYLEWINSAYQNEIGPGDHASARTCQDCHMTGKLNGTQIQTQIAVVEDEKYPAAEHVAREGLNVPIRADGYSRHQFQGLNVFLLSMFDQFNEQLGVRKCDYMSSGCAGKEPASGIPFALRNFAEQTARETATVAVSKPSFEGSTLTADVTITNLTGHRFPSGVSFRRAFIDFIVSGKDNKVLFESGATNSIGAIVDASGTVLPSEYNGSAGERGHAFQPHFWTGNPITRSDQVQIYEELLKDADGNFTTSFIRQDCHFKDNRILPLGWRKSGPDVKQFHGKPLEETWSDLTGDDPYYADPLGGQGQSVVRYRVTLPPGTKMEDVSVSAQLYYQAIPPYYLLQRFEQAPEGTGTQRLLYITQALDTTKSPFPNWKLLVAQATR